MIRWLLSRVAVLLPTAVAVTFVAFMLLHLVPGDPVEIAAGERALDPADHARLLAELGLDQPLWRQYLGFIGRLAQGDFGVSVRTRESVASEFLIRFPATIELGLTALGIAVLLGIPAGIIAALRRGRAADHAVMTAALTGYSMPVFWWGLLLILFFSVGLGWTPVSGRIDVAYYVEPITGFLLLDSWLSEEPGAFGSTVAHLILPAVALATIPLAVIARMTRSAMLEVLGEDYVRTARAKGLSAFRVVNVHALRNALIPVVTVIGLQLGNMLSGAILTETIFSWPGIGKFLVEAIQRRDYPQIQGGIVIIAGVMMAVNLLVDLCYGLLNPQIRHARR